MKDYEIFSKCDKCGNSNNPPGVQYKVGKFDPRSQELNDEEINHRFGYARDVDMWNKRRIGEKADEYLMRTCRNCGYKWPEKVRGEI